MKHLLAKNQMTRCKIKGLVQSSVWAPKFNMKHLLAKNQMTRCKIKGLVQSSVWAYEFDMKHLKKAEGYSSRNGVNMTMKTII